MNRPFQSSSRETRGLRNRIIWYATDLDYLNFYLKKKIHSSQFPSFLSFIILFAARALIAALCNGSVLCVLAFIKTIKVAEATIDDWNTNNSLQMRIKYWQSKKKTKKNKAMCIYLIEIHFIIVLVGLRQRDDVLDSVKIERGEMPRNYRVVESSTNRRTTMTNEWRGKKAFHSIFVLFYSCGTARKPQKHEKTYAHIHTPPHQ